MLEKTCTFDTSSIRTLCRPSIAAHHATPHFRGVQSTSQTTTTTMDTTRLALAVTTNHTTTTTTTTTITIHTVEVAGSRVVASGLGLEGLAGKPTPRHHDGCTCTPAAVRRGQRGVDVATLPGGVVWGFDVCVVFGS